MTVPPPSFETSSVRIAPSLLSADFSQLGKEVEKLNHSGADWIHLDVMDGHFVPPITFGVQAIQALRKKTALPLDVHLMITCLETSLESFALSGADHLTIHPEATAHPHRMLQRIRSYGKKAGIALNPGTSLESIRYMMDMVDLILIMTVNPGFGGQDFLESMLPKIHETRQWIESSGGPIVLAVDGGITQTTAASVKAAGAHVLVAGSAVFKTQNYAHNIRLLKGE